MLATENDTCIGVLQIPVADFADRDRSARLGAILGWVAATSNLAQSDPRLRTRLLNRQDTEAANDDPAAATFNIAILENEGLQARGDGTDPEAAQLVIP